VDVYVLRGRGDGLETLLLRRAPGGRSPGSWEAVHGHIDADEPPASAAAREITEETGLVPSRLYNLSRTEAFYLHRLDVVAIVPVFAAFVANGEVGLSVEHDDYAWLPLSEARRRCSWPRIARALDDVEELLGGGDAAALEDVLRVR